MEDRVFQNPRECTSRRAGASPKRFHQSPKKYIFAKIEPKNKNPKKITNPKTKSLMQVLFCIWISVFSKTGSKTEYLIHPKICIVAHFSLPKERKHKKSTAQNNKRIQFNKAKRKSKFSHSQKINRDLLSKYLQVHSLGSEWSSVVRYCPLIRALGLLLVFQIIWN